MTSGSDNEDAMDQENSAEEIAAQKAAYQALDGVGVELMKTLGGHAAGKFFFFSKF